MGDLITVKVYENRILAEIGKNLLEVNGIESFIVADDLGGATQFPFSNTFGVSLQVKKEDLVKAKEILEN